jgi:hypothetical protein
MKTFPNVSILRLTLYSQYNGIQNYFNYLNNKIYKYDYYNEVWFY